MDRPTLSDLLTIRIPYWATNISVNGERIEFDMPDTWEPTRTSGIFLASPSRETPSSCRRWQYRR